MKLESHEHLFWKEVDSRMRAKLKVAAALVEGSAILKAPYDTGFLKGSIAWELVSNHLAIVGASAFYAPYLELGTSLMPPMPFLVPALMENRENLRRIFNA